MTNPETSSDLMKRLRARKFISDDFGDASDAHDILAVIDAALKDTTHAE